MPGNVLHLRRGNGAAQVFTVAVEHTVGQGHGPRHHLGFTHPLLRRQVQRHPAHGALGQHPHGTKRVPGGSGLLRLVGVGQYLAQRFCQHRLHIIQLGLQGLYTRLQLRRCRRHGHCAVGVQLGNRDRGSWRRHGLNIRRC